MTFSCPLPCARRLRSHKDGWRQADQDDSVQYKEQRVVRLEVKGGHHYYNEGPRHDDVEVVPNFVQLPASFVKEMSGVGSRNSSTALVTTASATASASSPYPYELDITVASS